MKTDLYYIKGNNPIINGELTSSKDLKDKIKGLSLDELINYIDNKIRNNALEYEVKILLVNHEDKRDDIIKLLNNKGYAVSGNRHTDNFIIINW